MDNLNSNNSNILDQLLSYNTDNVDDYIFNLKKNFRRTK